MPRVPPAADVPRSLGLFILHEKGDEEAFFATELAGFESVGVIAPAFLSGKRADIIFQGSLPQRSIQSRPIPAMERPAFGAAGEVAGEERAVAAGDFDIFELGLRAPGADADGARFRGNSGFGRVDLDRQNDVASVLAEHFLNVVAGQSINTRAVEIDQIRIPLLVIYICKQG